MNLIVLGLGSAFLLTLGLSAAPAVANLALACIDASVQSVVMTDRAGKVVIGDEVPCP